MHRWCVFALCACGRIGFDSASGDDARTDAVSIDAAADPDLLLHVTFDQGRPLEERGHAATCTGCPSTSAGRVGDAAGSFDGSRCIEIADAPDLSPPAFTLAAWVNAGALATDASIAGRSLDGTQGNMNSFELFQVPADQWCAAVNDSFACTTQFELSTWHHLAATYEPGAGLASFYYDGQKLEAVGRAPPMYANDPVLIGCEMNFGALQAFFVGAIDDVRLYRRALSEAEIAALSAP